ncbi:MAG: pyridoxal phosphate-dependent aminotransferase [Acidimicrobiaceae bacterium]|nr:pyridoxal phosphate-dependent aminotransferase [Acidimicrobiaceae bacterium]
MRANELKAAGIKVVGFGVGEPDFPTPSHIVEAAVTACKNPKYHKYSPPKGLPALREAVAAKTMRDTGLEIHPEQVLITNGGKQAVYNAFAALINPGDEVLLPAPYWTTYPEPISLFGGSAIPITTTTASGFRVTVEQLEAAYTSRTKALVFVSPSNPTGAVYPRSEIEAIGKWAVERNIWIVTDEIYEHLTYDEVEHHSMPVLVPEIRDKCLILNGVAKTYAMTGWRVGWMIGPSTVITIATNLQSHSTSNVCNVAQMAALAAVAGPLDAVEEMLVHFNRRRSLMHGVLSSIDGIKCPKPQGAFYVYCDIRSTLGRTFGGVTPNNSLELTELLLDQAQVAVVPGEAFGDPGGIRLSFALNDNDLIEGVNRIAELLS